MVLHILHHVLVLSLTTNSYYLVALTFRLLLQRSFGNVPCVKILFVMKVLDYMVRNFISISLGAKNIQSLILLSTINCYVLVPDASSWKRRQEEDHYPAKDVDIHSRVRNDYLRSRVNEKVDELQRKRMLLEIQVLSLKETVEHSFNRRVWLSVVRRSKKIKGVL